MVFEIRKLVAEGLGTALFVFFAVGVSTLSFGFNVAGQSPAAGVVATALAFGLVVLILTYAFSPISGAHLNPAVTLGFLLSRRIDLRQAIGYWFAQFAGALIGAGFLRAIFGVASGYSTGTTGLGENGYNSKSIIGLGQGGAFLAEVILTFMFVFVVLAVTRKVAWPPQLTGVVVGLALATANLVGIPMTGASVNPARSLGPAAYVGGTALSQLWLFIVAPLIGAIIAGLAVPFLYPAGEGAQQRAPGATRAGQPYGRPTPGMPGPAPARSSEP